MMITQIYVTWNPFLQLCSLVLFSLQYFPSFGKRAKICWMFCFIAQTLAIFFLLLTQKVNVPVSYASLERGITVTHI